MSVIVAIKENGVVYMGADSQTTTGRRKRNGLNETAFKITRLENGMLVGFCGRVAAKQAILSMEDVFVLDKEGGLNKKHIVKEIVPKLVDKMQLIGDEDSGALDVCILLAYKDKLYTELLLHLHNDLRSVYGHPSLRTDGCHQRSNRKEFTRDGSPRNERKAHKYDVRQGACFLYCRLLSARSCIWYSNTPLQREQGSTFQPFDRFHIRYSD